MTEFKACSTPTSISIPLSHLVWFFQKISITCSLGQNRWDKIENLFFIEKSPVHPNQCFMQSFMLLSTKLGQIQHWYWGQAGEFDIWKIKSFLEITRVSNFVSTSFLLGCGKFLKHKRQYFLSNFSHVWVLYIKRMVK